MSEMGAQNKVELKGKGAISSVRLEEKENLLELRGWAIGFGESPVLTLKTDKGYTIGEYTTGCRRDDVLRNSPEYTEDKLPGFEIKVTDEKLKDCKNVEVFIRSQDGKKKTRLVRKIERFIKDAKTALTKISYDENWQILWMRGHFYHPSKDYANIEIFVDDKMVAYADHGIRCIVEDDKYAGWICETVLDEPIIGSCNISIDCYLKDGRKTNITYKYHLDVEKDVKKDKPKVEVKKQPVLEQGKDSNVQIDEEDLSFAYRLIRLFVEPKRIMPAVKKRLNIVVEQHEQKQTIQKSDFSPSVQRERTIFLAMHNLDVEDRIDKLRSFEMMGAALKRFGWKLVVIHHSPFELKTDLEVVHFQKVKITPNADGDYEWQKKRTPEEITQYRTELYDATCLMNGHHEAMGRKTTWEQDAKVVLEEALKFEYLLRKHKPYLCILWHQWNSFAHMNEFIAREHGIKSVFAHEGFLADTLGLDDMGEMAESYPAQKVDEFNDLEIDTRDIKRAEDYIDFLVREKKDRKPQIKAGVVEDVVSRLHAKGKKVLFYAGVNDWQTGMLPAHWDKKNIHSPYFVDTYDALRELERVARENDFYVLFKPHPNTPPRVNTIASDRVIFLRNANIIECIQKCDVVASLMSTVLYGALVHNKPSILLGRMTLSGSGAVYEMTDTQSLPKLIDEAFEKANYEEKRIAWINHVARMLRYYLYPYSKASVDRLLKSHDDSARFLISRVSSGKFD